MLQATSSRPTMFLRTLLGLFDRFLMKIESLIFGFAACVLIFVTCIVAADALGRYLFNKPLFFTLELVSHFLLPIIMLMSAGLVLRSSRHISVDLFASMMPARLYLGLTGLALGAVVPVFWIMTYRVALTSYEKFEQGVSAIGVVPWPLWIEPAIYTLCMGLLTARLFHMAVTNLSAAVTGETNIGISLLHSHDQPLEESL